MGEDRDATGRLSSVVACVEEFDRFAAETMPELLDRATGHTKRLLKETGQWENDIAHERLALRWGYELVERFLICGRTEVPCRPLFLLDSLIAKYYSQPDPSVITRTCCLRWAGFWTGLHRGQPSAAMH
jgi:hypothetical protein